MDFSIVVLARKRENSFSTDNSLVNCRKFAQNSVTSPRKILRSLHSLEDDARFLSQRKPSDCFDPLFQKWEPARLERPNLCNFNTPQSLEVYSRRTF